MQIFGLLIPEKADLIDFAKSIVSGKAGVLAYLSLLGLMIGGVAIATIMIIGHGHTINTTSQIPWGLQISTYLFFALVSGGCIFTNFIGMMFFPDTYRKVASRVLFMGLITAIAGFVSLLTELGHPERMFYFMISPNPASPMFWMSVWYSLDIAIILVEYVNIQRHHHSQALLYTAFIIPVITYCSLGSLLGSVGTVPYFYSGLLPIIFLATGFLCGNALCSIVVALHSQKEGNENFIAPFYTLQKIGIGVLFVLTACRIIVGIASGVHGYEVFRELLTQNLFIGIGAALALPYAILVFNRSVPGIIVSSCVVLITQYWVRFDNVVSGFRIPNFQAYDMPERLTYTPSIFEFGVVIASISLVTIIYLVWEKTGMFEIAGKEKH